MITPQEYYEISLKDVSFVEQIIEEWHDILIEKEQQYFFLLPKSTFCAFRFLQSS